MALPSSVFETAVFVDMFPLGRMPARDLNDAIKWALDAARMRLNDEHFWRNITNNTEDVPYEAAVEGRHRIESARLWLMEPDAQGNLVFPGLDWASLNANEKSSYQGALLGMLVAGTPTGGADGQLARRLEGTMWVVQGSTLKPAFHRLRGAIDFCGLQRIGPIKNPLHGQTYKGFLIDENFVTHANVTPDPSTDATWFEPYHIVTVIEHDGATAFTRKCWPIMVRTYDSAGNPGTPSDVDSFGLLFTINNGNKGKTDFYLTNRGIEVVASDPAQDIFFNGINVFKHDHSGKEGMGVPVNYAGTGDDNPNGITFGGHRDAASPLIVQLGDDPTHMSRNQWYEATSGVDEFPIATMFPPNTDNLYGPMTRMIQFQFQYDSKISPDDPGRQRPFLVAVTVDPPEQPASSWAAVNQLAIVQFSGKKDPNMAGIPHELTVMLPPFTDTRVPYNAKFRFWVYFIGDYDNLDQLHVSDRPVMTISCNYVAWRY